MSPSQNPPSTEGPLSDRGSSTNRRLKIAVAVLALGSLFLSVCLGVLWHIKETADLLAQIANLQAQLADQKALRSAAEADLARANERRVREVLGEKEEELEAARKRISTLEKELADEKADKEKVKKALEEAHKVEAALVAVVQRRDLELANERRQRDDSTKEVASLRSQLNAAQDELKRVREEIGKFKGDSSPSKDLGDFLSKVGQPSTNSGYLDEHICADRGRPPGCTNPKAPANAPIHDK